MVDVPGIFDASDKWKTLPVQCVGGLNSSVDTLSYKPGEAFQLINFEPSLYGGYRRLSGFAKFDTTAITGTGKTLGVCVFPKTGVVVACRGANVMHSAGSGWTSITSARTSAGKYRFTRYLLSGTQKIAMADGVNPAATWDGTNYILVNGTSTPADPKYCTFWLNRLVLGGYSAHPGSVSISAPLSDTDFTGASGGIEINTSGVVTGVRQFRGDLYIFCQHQIFKLTGTDATNFVLNSETINIGCSAPDSIQEVNGNLVYLAADGMRTIAGTERIGDVALASLSKQILSITTDIMATTGSAPDNISSVVVAGKNQYRLFYPNDTDIEQASYGILGAVRQGHSVNETAFGKIIDEWEWAQIQGIKPHCADSGYITNSELVVHGGYDGFVYQQEFGNAFNGVNISASYLTAPLVLDDVEIRKVMQKLDVFYRVEGITNISTQMLYEFGDPNIPQPGAVFISEGGNVYTYDGANTKYNDVATYSSTRLTPKVSTNIQGSGFLIQVLFSSNDMNPSYSIQAFTLQYRPLGRR